VCLELRLYMKLKIFLLQAILTLKLP
jgi:hypothetical protein